MKLRYTDIFILITGLFFLFMLPAISLANEESYLWIEMDNAQRLRDGGLSLRLNLYYGRFPYKKNSVREIDNLEAFYIRKGLGKSSSGGCYKADINTLEHNSFININSPDENSYTLYVNGIINNGPERHYLFAKTTFALFGKSSGNNYNDFSADAEKINRQLEILTVPEFHYWPQTGSPLKISALYNGFSAVFNSISIHDERNPEKNIISGGNGEISYVPPDDTELNRKGSTAFKHTIVSVEHSEAGKKYISSRTLIFHRSRYGNYRLKMGVIIFGITMTGFFMTMYFIRKRSAF